MEKMETIQEAKQHLRDNFKTGTECPCCGQFVKQYKRRLNSGMAIFMINLYRLGGELNFVKLADVLHCRETTGYDYSILKHWNLIEQSENHDPEKKDAGQWKLTPAGVGFVKNFIKVSSHIKLYNKKVLGFDGEPINIVSALGKRFDYSELMGN